MLLLAASAPRAEDAAVAIVVNQVQTPYVVLRSGAPIGDGARLVVVARESGERCGWIIVDFSHREANDWRVVGKLVEGTQARKGDTALLEPAGPPTSGLPVCAGRKSPPPLSVLPDSKPEPPQDDPITKAMRLRRTGHVLLGVASGATVLAIAGGIGMATRFGCTEPDFFGCLGPFAVGAALPGAGTLIALPTFIAGGILTNRANTRLQSTGVAFAPVGPNGSIGLAVSGPLSF
jgi:hypothetical protein